VLGANVYDSQLETVNSKQETVVEVSSLSNGIYLVQIQIGTNVINKKLVSTKSAAPVFIRASAISTSAKVSRIPTFVFTPVVAAVPRGNRTYSSFSARNSGELQEQEQEQEQEPQSLLDSLDYDIREAEHIAEISVPESITITRNGDTVICSIAQETHPNSKVTVQWNVNEGPSYSEFVAEKMKKEQREEKEQRAQEASENGQQEVEEEDADEDEDYLGDDQEKNVILTINVKKGTDSVDFKCSVSKDQQIYLDSITFGENTLDDVMALNESTIEGLFGYLEELGVGAEFGNFVQYYNVSRKVKSNIAAYKKLAKFLAKE